jgi:hypothetical protein
MAQNTSAAVVRKPLIFLNVAVLRWSNAAVAAVTCNLLIFLVRRFYGGWVAVHPHTP